ncbi:MAG TPA: glycosyltransferase, partial [Vicinamibacterales bacterium]
MTRSSIDNSRPRLNVLHVIHDFLPRHRAGSEIYAASLASALAARHHVTVLCAEHDPERAHGHVTWRIHDGVPVVEIVNNWVGRAFEDSYRPALVSERIEQVLQAVQPDVVHVHNLSNLSLELPAMARARRLPIVATLHDYTLVCPSGGQRVHRAEAHVCASIDTTRCARCFKESPLYAQLSVGAISAAAPGGWVPKLAASARRRFPAAASRAAAAARHVAMVAVTPEAIDTRLARARQVFDEVDLFVAPSASMADEFVRLGVDRARMQVSANGQMPMTPIAVTRPRMPLRIGFVGTLVWHKGVHVLIDAVRALPGSGYELRI